MAILLLLLYVTRSRIVFTFKYVNAVLEHSSRTTAVLLQLLNSREQEGLPSKSGGRSSYGLGSPTSSGRYGSHFSLVPTAFSQHVPGGLVGYPPAC